MSTYEVKQTKNKTLKTRKGIFFNRNVHNNIKKSNQKLQIKISVINCRTVPDMRYKSIPQFSTVSNFFMTFFQPFNGNHTV